MDDIILRNTVVNGNKVVFQFETRGILQQYFTTNELFVEYDCLIEKAPVSILNTIFVSSILP